VRVHQQGLRGGGVKKACVQEDWQAWLPSAKAEVYAAYSEYLETAYNMFSVALNEALELRRIGKLGRSSQVISITPGLCRRLADPLSGLLRALSQHTRYYRTVSNAAPFDPSNFQGIRAQRTARLNTLLNCVFLSGRAQFLHKLKVLLEMVGRLEADFRIAAEELGMGISLNPSADWRTADIAHYDMNTCFRETQILLKSFLVSIPDEQLRPFQKAADEQMRNPIGASRPVYLVQPRRMAAAGGK
jgi:hypothetical protein